MQTQEWTRWDGGECPLDDDELIDLKFENGSILERYYPWDVKWNGENPGFGYLVGYRLSASGCC